MFDPARATAVFVIVIGFLLAGGSAQAEPLLTVSGNSHKTLIMLDRAELEAMATTTIQTTTLWTDGVQPFTGVLPKGLLEEIGVTK